MDYAEKVRENRLRRMAKRQGYELRKSRRRDPRAVDYGLYHIIEYVDARRHLHGVVAGASPWNYSMTLDDVEEWLLEENEARRSK